MSTAQFFLPLPLIIELYIKPLASFHQFYSKVNHTLILAIKLARSLFMESHLHGIVLSYLLPGLYINLAKRPLTSHG